MARRLRLGVRIGLSSSKKVILSFMSSMAINRTSGLSAAVAPIGNRHTKTREIFNGRSIILPRKAIGVIKTSNSIKDQTIQIQFHLMIRLPSHCEDFNWDEKTRKAVAYLSIYPRRSHTAHASSNRSLWLAQWSWYDRLLAISTCHDHDREKSQPLSPLCVLCG